MSHTEFAEMIDLQNETTLSLAEAARRLPQSAPGKPLAVSTLTRWISTGVRGVRLEASRLGGKWITSTQAIERFTESLTRQCVGECSRTDESHTEPSGPVPPSEQRRQRKAQAIERELAGFGL